MNSQLAIEKSGLPRSGCELLQWSINSRFTIEKMAYEELAVTGSFVIIAGLG